MSTNPVARVFTEEQSRAWLAEQRRLGDERRARSASQPAPKPQPLPEITDWNEARQARLQFELMRDETAALADANETQFHLCEQLRELEAILADNPTEQERRNIEGYRIKVTPSLPGVADTFTHVDGTLEKTKAKLAAVERELPLLQAKAERYEQLRQQLAVWPWHRINDLQNREAERSLISRGKPVQKRGQR